MDVEVKESMEKILDDYDVYAIEKIKAKPKVEIPKEVPPTGLTTQVYLKRVVDGDTLEVEFRRTFKVRLLDRWQPELGTPDGDKLKRELQEKLFIGEELTLFVPANKPDSLMDLNSFERILGHIWNKQGERL